MMKYVRLGRSGLKISKLILGTTNFGMDTGQKEATRIIDVAFERGINMIDTADAYGYHKGKGKTETIIGNWVKANPAKRDQIVLATKLNTPMTDDVNDRGLSAFHLRRACEASLRRLQVDHIDLYMMHSYDPTVPWDEIWQGLEQLIREGKISYVGSSNFSAWQLAGMAEFTRQRGLAGIVSEESRYNLTDRSAEKELIPATQHYGIGFIPYSPVHYGMLGGVLKKERVYRLGPRAEQRDKQRAQIEQYEALCDELGLHPAAVATAWVLANPHVTAPIVGPRTLEHLAGYLSALDVELSEETMARLEDIWH